MTPLSEAIVSAISHIDRVQRILLDNGPMTMRQILEEFQKQTRRVPTRNRLGNILSKNPRCFYEHGKIAVKSTMGDYRDQIVWAHVNDETVTARDGEE